MPRDSEGPVFKEPWEARAFAMAVQLSESGLFTWSEWTAVLAHEIATANATPATERPYYEHWLAALETLVQSAAVIAPEELERRNRAWRHAAQRTPHGQPIELSAGDLA